MTEHEWLTGTYYLPMLEYAQGWTSQRKLRLFGVANCRLIWHLLTLQNRSAIEVAVRFADGQATEEELDTTDASSGIDGSRYDDVSEAMYAILARDGFAAAIGTAEAAKVLAVTSVEGSICACLRHIVGNPFRPYPAPPAWPADVVRLAEAMYAGADVAFALADALLDASHPELAEHFRAEIWHRKGCWVVDTITGRK